MSEVNAVAEVIEILYLADRRAVDVLLSSADQTELPIEAASRFAYRRLRSRQEFSTMDRKFYMALHRREFGAYL